MELFFQDLVYGLRGALSRKGFSLVVVITLGLAIGVNTTLFSLVSTVLFASLPFEDPGSIVFLWSRNQDLNRVREPVSLPDFQDLRRELESFRGLAAFRRTRFALTGAGEPLYVQGMRASVGFFPLTGVALTRGRSFLEGEDRPGASPVAVLSHGAWERRFGSDPGILGRTLELDSVSHAVVGVLDPSASIGHFAEVEIWTPLPAESSGRRDERDLYVLGRLGTGVSFDQAFLEVESASKRLSEAHPEAGRGWLIFPQPVLHALVGPNVKTVTLLMTMTVGFVLFIGCANVAHLLLARAEGRRRELQLRAALGATRIRLLRQLLTEALVLSALGSILGLFLTHWTLRAIEAVSRGEVSLFAQTEVDFGVLGFALAMGFVTPLLFALVPGLSVSTGELKQRSASPRSSRARQILVAGEVALALVLLVVAGLAVSSIRALRAIDLGFRPERVLTLELEVPSSRQPSAERTAQFFDDVLRAAASLPGARAASLASQRPIEGSGPNQTFAIDGSPVPESEASPSAATVVVSPGFFSTLGIGVLEGRDFSSSDTAASTRVGIVSRAAGERYWPARSPVGSTVRLADGAPLLIVGLVSDVRNSDADQPPEPHLYLSHSQNPARSMALLLRAENDALGLAPSMRSAIREIDPTLPIEDMRTMEQIVFYDLAGDFAVVGLMTYFTLVALGLATAGIGAVVSHTVSERSKEIGVRMAVGARSSQVLAMILRQGMIPVAAGLAAGLALSLTISRMMASMVYGVSPSDPVTYVLTTGLLLVVASAASLVPAVRAARMDPVSVLRGE
jgi:predicted permease